MAHASIKEIQPFYGTQSANVQKFLAPALPWQQPCLSVPGEGFREGVVNHSELLFVDSVVADQVPLHSFRLSDDQLYAAVEDTCYCMNHGAVPERWLTGGFPAEGAVFSATTPKRPTRKVRNNTRRTAS